MSINWQNLRSWNGNQHTAFEELCCQLAGCEPAPPGSRFTRKGAPDAGVECFWRLPSGDQWAWQAKFFVSRPDDSQWRQIDDSVKTALDKHPRLTTYTICLPVDRQDPRITDDEGRQQHWFMDRWNERVATWRYWADEKGKSVEFEYWGEHEIFTRLSREEHRGRYLFWFNQDLFSREWFDRRLAEVIADAGERYTPELNVELPVAKLFDGLGRTSDFYARIKTKYGIIRRAFDGVTARPAAELVPAAHEALAEPTRELLPLLAAIDSTEVELIDFPRIALLAEDAAQRSWDYIEAIRQASEKKQDSDVPRPQPTAGADRDRLRFIQNHAYKLAQELRGIASFANSSEAALANVAALMLCGYAGTGKTHLFCDVTKARLLRGAPSVLLLGQHFALGDPWTQISTQLGLSCTKEEFLGALEAAAQASGTKALLMIDALNEGEGRVIWKNRIAGMLALLSRYPSLAVAVSVRSSYESAVVPESLKQDRLVRATHHGFADHEYQATKTFFAAFGIVRPSVPLLNPEFENPLFLKLFCKGLKNRGMTEVPKGFHGVSTVFDFLIDSINAKLSAETALDFDWKQPVVHRALEHLAEAMATQNRQWLERDEAAKLVSAELPRPGGYQASLFCHLLSEGLLAEDRFYLGPEKWEEGVRFAYERLSDHMIVRHMLDRHLDSTDPAASFRSDQPLGALVADGSACYRNRGLVAALAIQLPERVNRELPNLAPHAADFAPVRQSVVESLVWRVPTAITEATRAYINEHVIRWSDTQDQLLDAFLTVAANPDHPYNAGFLHAHLQRFTMAERDAWWSIFLHEQCGAHGAVDRLVDWAWSPEDKGHIEDASILLAGTALAWFLTTSNRFLRDRATKALVTLLTQRLPVLRQLIERFIGVNDLYVLERLFAVAYGCAMRSIDDAGVRDLAVDVFRRIFENGQPIPHILLRDYARGVVECALHRGAVTDVDRVRIRPPYRSEWCDDIPSEEELKKLGEWREGMPEEEWARVHLYQSVMGQEDFARYVIGTNTSFEWSNRRLGAPPVPTRKELYDAFVASLTSRQKRALDRYVRARQSVDLYIRMDAGRRTERLGHAHTEEELQAVVGFLERTARKSLGKRKGKEFERIALPFLSDPYRDDLAFDLRIAQRWVVRKAFDMGWTVERFGHFDRNLSPEGRSAHKAERIGKKYQWLAWHEFLARVSDNFEYRGDRWNKRDREYEGPWQVHARDIDPSCTLPRTADEDRGEHHQSWWFPSSYDAWAISVDDLEWLQSRADLPPIGRLLEVVNPNDGSRWLALRRFVLWEQPTLPEEDPYRVPRRQIWYMLNAYVVRRKDAETAYHWAVQQDFMGRWMPESHELFLYYAFLGEFFWAPAFGYHNDEFFGLGDWRSSDRVPVEVLIPSIEYAAEGNVFDCSLDDGCRIYTPSKWLADGMGLSWRGREGEFFDASGRLVAYDPSVREPGPGTLLVDRGALLRYSNDADCEILWTVLGEKLILSSDIGGFEGRLNISGAYRFRDGRLEGALNIEFKPPPRNESPPSSPTNSGGG